MRQHRPNVHLSAIVMNCGYQASLVAADVEHCQSADLIRVRKYAPQFRKVRRIILFQRTIPMNQSGFRHWMFCRKVVQPFACDDMHSQRVGVVGRERPRKTSTRHSSNEKGFLTPPGVIAGSLINFSSTVLTETGGNMGRALVAHKKNETASARGNFPRSTRPSARV